jgi:transitional endoplasmic reticulum ATPase
MISANEDISSKPLEPFSNKNSLEVGEIMSQDHSTALMHPSKLRELNLYDGDTVMIVGRKSKSTCVQIKEDNSISTGSIHMTRIARSNVRYKFRSTSLFTE